MTIEDIKNKAIEVNKKHEGRTSYATSTSPIVSANKTHFGFNAASKDLLGSPETLELYFVLEEQRVYVVPSTETSTSSYKFKPKELKSPNGINYVKITTSLINYEAQQTVLTKVPNVDNLFYFDFKFEQLPEEVTE